MGKFNQCTGGLAHLKSFPSATSKGTCCTHLKRGIFPYSADTRGDQ